MKQANDGIFSSKAGENLNLAKIFLNVIFFPYAVRKNEKPP